MGLMGQVTSLPQHVPRPHAGYVRPVQCEGVRMGGGGGGCESSILSKAMFKAIDLCHTLFISG